MSNSKTNVSKNQPAHEIRIGPIKAIIWRNQTVNGAMHNAVPVRIYRDDAGQWHESHSFNRDDLLLVAKVLDMAHSWIVESERK